MSWQPRYSSSREDLVSEFYARALANSLLYRRAAGYFRSTLFTLVGEQFAAFALRGGKIRLICSPELTETDANAIRAGAALAEICDEAMRREFDAVLRHPL